MGKDFDPMDVLSGGEDVPSKVAKVKVRESDVCRFCGGEIPIGAVKCRHCGEFLDEDLKRRREREAALANITPAWNRGIAAVLSLVLPGLGQMYKGRIGAGFLWMIFTALGYAALILPGVLMHVLSVVSAASGDPYEDARRQHSVKR